MASFKNSLLPTQILDVLPNPILVKNSSLEYVWVNQAFEELFSIKKEDLIGRLDKELFPDRQVTQCNGGDLRVLNSGEIDEAVERVFRDTGEPRDTITRKIRLTLEDGQDMLLGIMHDITEVTQANLALESTQAKLEAQAFELERLANTDPLTGCGNRNLLTTVENTMLKTRMSRCLFC